MRRPEHSDEIQSCAESGSLAWQNRGKWTGEKLVVRSFEMEDASGWQIVNENVLPF